jgi:hypothetical protein
MRAAIAIIKRVERDVKFLQMVMSILENIIKIKNMEKELSFGLVSVKQQVPNCNIRKYSNTKVCGGEAYQMEKVSMKNRMVNQILFRRFLFRVFQKWIKTWLRSLILCKR